MGAYADLRDLREDMRLGLKEEIPRDLTELGLIFLKVPKSKIKYADWTYKHMPELLNYGINTVSNLLDSDNLFVYKPEYEYVRNTPFVETKSFTDAFAEARNKGLKTFIFNGKEYTTEISDSPTYSKPEYETHLMNRREVLDDDM